MVSLRRALATLIAIACTTSPGLAQFSSAGASLAINTTDKGTPSIAVGDFNGDGKFDFAVTNPSNNEVRIFLGNGAGGFSNGAVIGVGNYPTSIATADFDGDGKLDLAVANQNDSTVTILQGSGTGAFAQFAGKPLTVAVGAIPVGLVSADFNHDGKQDIATANNSGHSVTVLAGDGAGGFTTSTIAGLGTPVALAAVGANLVVVDPATPSLRFITAVAGGGSVVSLLLPAGALPLSIATGDFDEDGIADFAVFDPSLGKVYLYKGNGVSATAFPGSPLSISSATAIAATDFDGDGHIDLVIAKSTNNNNIEVYLGSGTGGFTSSPGSPFSAPNGRGLSAVIAANLDGDAKPDILVSQSGIANNPDNEYITPFLNALPRLDSVPASLTFNAAVGQPAPATLNYSLPLAAIAAANQPWLSAVPSATALGIGVNPTGLAAGDYRGRVLVTAAGYFGSSTNVILHLVKPAGALPTASGSPFSGGPNGQRAAVGDFNGDGIPDLVVVDQNMSGSVLIALGNGNGTFTTTTTNLVAAGSSNLFDVVVGDFNGDGHADLAIDSTAPNQVQLFLGDGTGNFTAMPPVMVSNPIYGLTAADFNGDGKLDLAVSVQGVSVGALEVLLGDGNGHLARSPGSPFAVSYEPVDLISGDFNGDGRPDVGVASSFTSKVYLMLGNGGGGLVNSPSSPFNTVTSSQAFATGDFNGDGNPDLAATNLLTNTVTVLLGDGAGGFSAAPGSPFVSGNRPYSVAAADFNGDGNLDLAVANVLDNTVAILLGNGVGGFTAIAAPLALPFTPTRVLAADFNNDGRSDLAVVGGGQVAIFLGGLSATTSALTSSATAVNPGVRVVLTAQVTQGANALGTVGGNVVFYDGGTQVGSSALGAGGVAAVTSTPLTTVGIHRLTATYAGDARNNTSVSNAVSVSVNPAAASKLAFTVSPSIIPVPNSPIAFTIQVQDQFGNLVSTSAASITLSSTINGVTTAIGTFPASNGAYSTTLTFALPGTYIVSAASAGLTATSITFTVILPPTLTVTNLSDSGAGSLRSAITSANGVAGSNIVFGAGLSGTIALGSGVLSLTQSTTIDGIGAAVTISGSDLQQIFDIVSGTIAIRNLSLVHGKAVVGGGAMIIAPNATVSLMNCQINNNVELSSSEGGAIYNFGRLTVTGCSFSGNTEFQNSGGAIATAGPLTILNSTFTSNTAFDGGAISILGGTPSLVAISGSTFSANSAEIGGAIENQANLSVSNCTIFNNTASSFSAQPGRGGGLDNSGTLTITDTTIYGNIAQSTVGSSNSAGISNSGTLTLQNSILSGNTNNGNASNCSGCGAQAAVNFIGGNPGLGALANNGGPTQTLIPLPGSAVIGAGGSSGAVLDQRANLRPNPITGAVDVGAVQTQYTLGFVQQPTAANAGFPVTPPVSVRTLESGLLFTQVPVAVTLSVPGGATGIGPQLTANGVASFPALAPMTPGLKTIIASATSFPLATSTPFSVLTNLSVAPASQNLNYVIGSPLPIAQSVSVTSAAGPVSFTANVIGAPWLSVPNPSGTTPGTIAPAVNPTGLNPGSYAGAIQVTSPFALANPPTHTVSLTVQALLGAAPGSINFSLVSGSAVNSVLLAITANGSLTANVLSSAPWLTINGANSASVNLAANQPANLTISLNPAALSLGAYSGTIIISSPNAANSVQVKVSANVSVPLVVSPTSLSFTAYMGLAAPSAQSLSVTSMGIPIGYTASATTGSWLHVSSSPSTTPGINQVSVDQTGLSPGTYSGTIFVSAPQGTPSGTIVNVTLTVPKPGPIQGVPTSGVSFSGSGSASMTQVLHLTNGSDGVPVPFSIGFVQAGTTPISSSSLRREPQAATASFLTVSPSAGVTPAVVSLTTNSVPAGFVYSGTLTIVTPSQSISIPVTYSVPPTAPLTLKLQPTAISLSTIQGGAASGSFLIQTSGGSTSQNYSVSASNLSNIPIQVSPQSGSLSVGGSQQVQVFANTSNLTQPGYYQGTITVKLAGLPQPQIIPVYLNVLPKTPVMTLEYGGFSFAARAGEGTTVTENISVLNTGGGTLTWTASIQGNSPWLTLRNASGVSTVNNPSMLTLGVNSAFAQTATTAANYSAVVQVTAQELPGESRLMIAFLTLSNPQVTPPDPLPSPTGLVFQAQQGAPDPDPQIVQVFTSSQIPVPFQASPQTNSGAMNWLSVTPASGTASTTAPGLLSASVHTANLPAGVYRGGVTASISGTPRVINVTFIVTPAPASSSSSAVWRSAAKPKPEDSAGCVVSSLVPTIVDGLTDNFNTNLSGPTAIKVQVTDNCGNLVPVPKSSDPPAIVTISFDTQTPGAYTMALTDTRHSGYTITWTPDQEIPITTVTVTATLGQITSTTTTGGTGQNAGRDAKRHSNAAAASPVTGTTQVSGQVSPSSLPALRADGTTNYFNSQPGAFSPGAVISLSGRNLSGDGQSVSASGTSLPLTLDGTQVTIGGEAAPVLFVSPTQVLAQVPTDLPQRTGYPVQVIVNKVSTVPNYIDLALASPSLAEAKDGTVLAQHGDYTAVTTANPAQPGEAIAIYITGMGATIPMVPSGVAAPGTPPFAQLDPTLSPAVTLNGVSVGQLLFAGLTPGAYGLYQVNFVVPANSQPGPNTIVVSAGNVASNLAVLPIGAVVAAAPSGIGRRPEVETGKFPGWAIMAPLKQIP